MNWPAVSPGTGRLGPAVGIAVSSVLLLTSCGFPASPPAGTAPASQTQGSTTTPSTTTPSATTPASEGPASGWTTFTTTAGELSFDYPAGWTVKDPGGALTGEFVDVLNAEGKPIAGLRTNIVTGAECVDKTAYQVYDSEPMLALAEGGGGDGGVPRYVFESRGEDTDPVATQSTIAAYGITMVPEESGATACPMFHLFLWPPSGAFFGGTYNPENNTTPGDPSLPYLEKAKLYAATPEYQDIRKMITSLRPAGATAGVTAGK
ncbi:hypothetical protein J2X01_002937 [Arthrobacter ginsengisoli]|uniref:Lipoprotein n=1 Tax=Arthrobacter ginsengisoli TaxID=1356565 RepID=A0ABU1UEP4_9MICC|nr:hypothetical protein [Arthrobacter ginsengisoli]MDR7083642.1 hypothetical protein [Arthrobacter ginsengisoli]